MKRIQLFILSILAAITFACGPVAIISTPIENIDALPLKISQPSDKVLKSWLHTDLLKDTIPGMSVNLAYKEILNGRKGEKVIVGVIDSGIDIEHEDLKNIIWINKDEVPDNGIDDDKNGYIDDVHGWNFLGKAIHENLELVRIIKKGDDGSDMYKRAKKEYEEERQNAQQAKTQYEQISQMVNAAEAVVKKELGKDTYTKEDLESIKSDDPQVLRSVGGLKQMFAYGDSIEEVKDQLKEGITYFTEQLDYHLNLSFDGRLLIKDDPNDFNDRDYGNNNVIGPDKEEATHGTHVAGIIAAQRNNSVGIKGVAENVSIMALRAVPNGDEYDKDIALAIRYAVDNGARVINTSFGKYYSPHPDWVHDAIVYAASKDVLIVNASGNESYDLDKTTGYPNDSKDQGTEIADNFLTVGALHHEYGSSLVANFSNYGKYNVDVFAPGTKIWSTTPNNNYEFLQGTSMASPAVAGIAAILRSQFPKLTAPQVKRIIMKSGLSVKQNVVLGGDPNNKKAFNDVSSSGKIANLYNALIMADKVSRGKINL